LPAAVARDERVVSAGTRIVFTSFAAKFPLQRTAAKNYLARKTKECVFEEMILFNISRLTTCIAVLLPLWLQYRALMALQHGMIRDTMILILVIFVWAVIIISIVILVVVVVV